MCQSTTSQHATLAALTTLASTIEPVRDYWIGNYPNGDNCSEYCRTCCEKHLITLTKGFHPPSCDDRRDAPLLPLNEEDKQRVADESPFIDGGWGSEFDRGLPHCSTCHAALTGSLTETAIDEEFQHYLTIGEATIEITTPDDAWGLLLLLECAPESRQADIDTILNKVTTGKVDA